MAWNSTIPSSTGSVVKVSDIGEWLTAINTQASAVINSHCTSVYSVYKSAYYTSDSSTSYSNNGQNSVSDKNNNSSVNFGGTASSIKCGGEIVI